MSASRSAATSGLRPARRQNHGQLSGDARWATYDMDSNFLPTEFVNCTGLRMCLANGGAPVRWVQNTNARWMPSNDVYEVALEMNIPLLKDVPGIQELSANLAGRYTKYSTFDAVEPGRPGSTGRSTTRCASAARISSDYPGAEPQRPVPAGRRFFDGLQGPADGRQQQPAADHARQSRPDAGGGPHDHARASC